MPLTTSAAPKQLSDGNSQGTVLGYPQTVIMPDGIPDKIGFFGATPVVQATPSAVTTGYTAGSGTAVTIDGKFSGNVGTTTYTIGDLVAIMKGLGLLKA